ncbi:hypothetical protein TNCV_4306221 [Trichonephila clavipes]|nr:hypothetical protein TNCV_4306221 [Trichonephila clavipes]
MYYKELISPDFMTTCLRKYEKRKRGFEGRDSGWTPDEILRLEVRTNRCILLSRGSSSTLHRGAEADR